MDRNKKYISILLGTLLIYLIGIMVENLIDYYIGVIVGICLFMINALFDK